MPLTYFRLDDFLAIKEIETSEDDDPQGYEVIRRALIDATRWIDRITRRRFFPVYEMRSFAVPNEMVALRRRWFPFADLRLDRDLLEVALCQTGETGSLTTLTEGIDEEFVTLPFNIYPKFGLRLTFPNSWSGQFATFGGYRLPRIFVTGWWGYHENYDLDAWIDTSIDLGADLNDTATTFEIALTPGTDALGYTDIRRDELLRIDDEMLDVVSVEETGGDPATERTVTVRRGSRGTTAAEHLTGASIRKWHVHEDIARACMIIAKSWREAAESVGGNVGAPEYSTAVATAVPDDARAIALAYQRTLIKQVNS